MVITTVPVLALNSANYEVAEDLKPQIDDIEKSEKNNGMKISISHRITTPQCFYTPLRPDVVSKVHDLIMKNQRQPHAVAERAGKKYSAKSWHTGRAVSRVPRVKGSGTSIAGNGAWANFCKGGHMAHPLTLSKRLGRLVNDKERKLAIRSALAATCHANLLQARGHKGIENLQSVPIVIKDSHLESIKRSKDAKNLLTCLGIAEDLERCKKRQRSGSRAGKGKMRGRQRRGNARGPLIVFKDDQGLTKAFRNLEGVSLMQVDRMNLLKLAPGGHLGRLVIFSENAFKSLSDDKKSKMMMINTSLSSNASDFGRLKKRISNFLENSKLLKELKNEENLKIRKALKDTYNASRRCERNNSILCRKSKSIAEKHYCKLMKDFPKIFSSISK